MRGRVEPEHLPSGGGELGRMRCGPDLSTQPTKQNREERAMGMHGWGVGWGVGWGDGWGDGWGVGSGSKKSGSKSSGLKKGGGEFGRPPGKESVG